MLRLLLETVKEWVEEIIASLGLITTYNTMPNDSVLLAMQDGTTFSTRGYYNPFDGYGGTYYISGSKVPWAKKITSTNGTTTKYLVAMADSGTPLHTINMGRYGIRPMADDLDLSNATLVSDDAKTGEIDTYAKKNSDILEALINDNKLSWNHNMTFYFGKGRFYFERPISLVWINPQTSKTKDIAINLVGASEQVRTQAEIFRGTNYAIGTILCFPFLADGDTAITIGSGTIENLCVYGDKNDYYFHIDRYANIRNEGDSVINETINKSIIGIDKIGSGYIRNVGVLCFDKGIQTALTNIYVDNVFVRNCHSGLISKNDTKITRLFAWDVHTPIEVKGALTSVVQARADSCVNMIKLAGSISGCTFVDIDGDWCADSLILIDKDANISECTFEAIHGRCCTLNYYDKNTTPVYATAFDNYAMPSKGYGLIHSEGGNFFKNTIGITKISANAFDGDKYDYIPKGGAEKDRVYLTGMLKYQCPIILFTADRKTENGSPINFNISNNNFTLSDTFNDSALFDQSYFRRRFQTAGTSFTRVNVSAGSGFQKYGAAFQIVSYNTLKSVNDSLNPTDINFVTLLGGDN